ncbi:HlyD family type I secretion periplasmic adaptor subunit [Collibacillus ludicampi]|uniref:HlyD family type I secretion periplasmic adaptor subunit n=1 Tax=Collibacillus ludicampi TaxID=2771369 RepID=A0AAV4LKR9_9BACL|nr:HlyD family efflux transporter periplasmic adaptor subunit [Collibacillus ludicampi]GIM48396.1 HlyD family type I secretion periplasmic adaptor subunit [Collibacillus ludicampi]
MKLIIQDISELTDSRELLDSNPLPITTLFLYILVAFLIGTIIWSYFGEIDDYVKANGIVRPNNKISTIKNRITGKVEKIFFEEGKEVKKGDILYTIEHKDLDVQKANMTKELEKTKSELDNLKKLKQSILDDRNYFDETSENEKPYFYKYIKYEIDKKALIEQTTNSQLDIVQASKQASLDQQYYQQQINQYSKNIEDLNRLKQSIDENTNPFDMNNKKFFDRWEDYKINIQKLKSIVDQKKKEYDVDQQLENAGAIAPKDVKDAKNNLDSANLDLEEYKSKFLLDISTEITDNKKTLAELQNSLDKARDTLNVSSGKEMSVEVAQQQYKIDTLTKLDDQIKEDDTNIDKLQKDLDDNEINLQNCTVTSPIDGVVNVIKEINKGDLLQSGDEVITIIPKNSSQYRVELYVSNKDIANIKVGQQIKYHFLALPYQEYGELTGTISRIGTDSKTDQQGNSFYTVEATLDNKPLYSYKGIPANIKVGMACEAHVITKTKKILYYLLEKINLKE